MSQLIATDEDKGENGKVWYYLQPTGDKDFEHFNLDRVSGNLTVEQRLDLEKQAIYKVS